MILPLLDWPVPHEPSTRGLASLDYDKVKVLDSINPSIVTRRPLIDGDPSMSLTHPRSGYFRLPSEMVMWMKTIHLQIITVFLTSI